MCIRDRCTSFFWGLDLWVIIFGIIFCTSRLIFLLLEWHFAIWIFWPQRNAIGLRQSRQKYKSEWTSQNWNGTVNVGSYVTTHTSFYGTIHYLTREVRVKLHAKTNTARIARRWVRYRFSLNRIIFRIISWKKKRKENSSSIVWVYPERELQKAISNSTVKTAILSANEEQGQSYLVKVKVRC